MNTSEEQMTCLNCGYYSNKSNFDRNLQGWNVSCEDNEGFCCEDCYGDYFDEPDRTYEWIKGKKHKIIIKKK
tara:strand:+ start:4900 stop:5115 length:216 start_codon:yes stop_codon:yes gene_type:complete